MVIARKNKNDEFYTKFSDIENELKHYVKYFENKTILCNCDDPRMSNFFHYFLNNFEKLKLKKLIIIGYKSRQMKLFSKKKPERAIHLEYEGGIKTPTIDNIGIKYLKKDGDFRNRESIEILKQADIIVTNPPFSLFREYVTQLIKYEKKFIIIGSQNAVTYREIFPLIKNNKIWYGYNTGKMEFNIPDYYELDKTGCREDETGQKWQILGNTSWFTNLYVKKRHEKIILNKKYSSEEYQKYDNYNAINIMKIKDIPMDYAGEMGVPITFLEYYNPDQFEIINLDVALNNNQRFKINGKILYARIIIKKKN